MKAETNGTKKSKPSDEVETVTFIEEQPSQTAKDEAERTAKTPETVAVNELGKPLAQEVKDEGLIAKLKKQLGTPDQEGMEKAVNKIRIKLSKFGRIIAEAEQYVYEHYKLNNFMKPEEVEAEKNEVVEDTNIMLETRLKLVSQYGDIINLSMDFLGHITTRALRVAHKKRELLEAQQGKIKPENQEIFSSLGLTPEQFNELLGK